MRTIYVLRDPVTLVVRYVGMTRETVEGRLARHVDRAWRENAEYHVHRWIRTLTTQPLVEAIDEASDEDCGLVEQAWIAHYRDQGARLTNMTDGGESGWGPSSWSAQARLREDPAYRAAVGAKISAAKKGVPMPEHQREVWSRVMSEAWSGRPKSLAWRKAASESQVGQQRVKGYKLSDETRSRQSAAQLASSDAPVSCVECRKICRGLYGVSAHLWRAHQMKRQIVHARPWEVEL